jgi:hypothetical protein
MKNHQSFQQKYWGMSSLLLRSRAVCAISQQKPTPASKANRRCGFIANTSKSSAHLNNCINVSRRGDCLGQHLFFSLSAAREISIKFALRKRELLFLVRKAAGLIRPLERASGAHAAALRVYVLKMIKSP